MAPAPRAALRPPRVHPAEKERADGEEGRGIRQVAGRPQRNRSPVVVAAEGELAMDQSAVVRDVVRRRHALDRLGRDGGRERSAHREPCDAPADQA